MNRLIVGYQSQLHDYVLLMAKITVKQLANELYIFRKVLVFLKRYVFSNLFVKHGSCISTTVNNIEIRY